MELLGCFIVFAWGDRMDLGQDKSRDTKVVFRDLCLIPRSPFSPCWVACVGPSAQPLSLATPYTALSPCSHGISLPLSEGAIVARGWRAMIDSSMQIPWVEIREGSAPKKTEGLSPEWTQ